MAGEVAAPMSAPKACSHLLYGAIRPRKAQFAHRHSGKYVNSLSWDERKDLHLQDVIGSSLTISR